MQNICYSIQRMSFFTYTDVDFLYLRVFLVSSSRRQWPHFLSRVKSIILLIKHFMHERQLLFEKSEIEKNFICSTSRILLLPFCDDACQVSLSLMLRNSGTEKLSARHSREKNVHMISVSS